VSLLFVLDARERRILRPVLDRIGAAERELDAARAELSRALQLRAGRDDLRFNAETWEVRAAGPEVVPADQAPAWPDDPDDVPAGGDTPPLSDRAGG
jgi:hypothetical protein